VEAKAKLRSEMNAFMVDVVRMVYECVVHEWFAVAMVVSMC
jgi:hypothetical protein